MAAINKPRSFVSFDVMGMVSLLPRSSHTPCEGWGGEEQVHAWCHLPSGKRKSGTGSILRPLHLHGRIYPSEHDIDEVFHQQRHLHTP